MSNILSQNYYFDIYNTININPTNSSLRELFRQYYSKIYDKLPGYPDPIGINNILFTKKYRQQYNNSDTLDDDIDKSFARHAGIIIADKTFHSNFPAYFLSKEFVDNVKNVDIDKNIALDVSTLPFESFFYILPNGESLKWFSLTYLDGRDDILFYGNTINNEEIFIVMGDALTSPDVDENQLHTYNPHIIFALGTLLMHQTGGFDRKIIPTSPLPLMKDARGRVKIGQRKRVSANILRSPKITHINSKDTTIPSEPFNGYKTIPTHIRILKDKATGQIKVVAVSSSEVNPHKKTTPSEFSKHKMTDEEMYNLIRYRKQDIINRMRSRNFSEDEIQNFLKSKNIIESFTPQFNRLFYRLLPGK
jgi:hypothetical protein